MSYLSDRLSDEDCDAIAAIVARARQRLARQAAAQPAHSEIALADPDTPAADDADVTVLRE